MTFWQEQKEEGRKRSQRTGYTCRHPLSAHEDAGIAKRARCTHLSRVVAKWRQCAAIKVLRKNVTQSLGRYDTNHGVVEHLVNLAAAELDLGLGQPLLELAQPLAVELLHPPQVTAWHSVMQLQ